ncbi:hypothetical protein ACIRLA_21895 [Streptomyces sp. NPDC102364]|uniref:hypothetical protein n=1 Tax=Streptomyces sp. NPDC102364 TaxID=3366161 RepID=UPI003800D26F
MSWGEGSMNWAELRDLVQALPEDSATKAATAGGEQEEQRWNNSTFLQAATYNALLVLVRILWVAHLKGSPPDMQAISPPSLSADATEDEAAVAISEHLLNQYSPAQPEADPDGIAEWEQRIRELEAQGV